MEGGPDGGKGPFGRVRGGDQPFRGDLPKIEVLGVDHGADQTGRGAEPEQRRRRRFDRDAHAERRAQRGRGNSGRQHDRRTGEGSCCRLNAGNLAGSIPADRRNRRV